MTENKNSYFSSLEQQSLLIVGSSGAGKTKTLFTWVDSAIKTGSPAQFFIASRQRDRWLELGLSSESVQEIGKKDEDCRKLFCHIKRVSGILYRRIDSKEERHPVWLVLDDWSYAASILNRMSGDIEKEWKACLTNIANIIVLGREQKVGVCIAAYSTKSAALGLAEDTDVSACVSILDIDHTRLTRV